MKKVIAYHGTRDNFSFDEMSFDHSSAEMIGIHWGTKRAAVERANKYDDTVSEWKGEEIEDFFEDKPEIFFCAELSFRNCLGFENPISENKMATLDRESLIAGGFDGIAYINDFEDEGSISYIVLEMDQCREIVL